MSWCMCLATAVHGLPAAFLRAVSPGAGAAAFAAGINLNFWPAGPIFRRLGRSLFAVRLKAISSIPPFSVRSRRTVQPWLFRRVLRRRRSSRTGRLLDPKTGTLSMTIQACCVAARVRLR